jgi:hypothetical protein
MTSARDQDHIRDLLSWVVDQYGPDAVRGALATLDSRPHTVEAIRDYLQTDLAAWPGAFQNHLQSWTRFQGVEHARDTLSRFERAREPRSAAPQTRSGCACGCFGQNSELGGRLEAIRRAAHELNHAATQRKRSNRREHLELCKADLLHWLWFTGQRRIDRRPLAQHALEAAKEEMQRLEDEIVRCEDMIARLNQRLELGAYQKGPRKGQPLTEHDRQETETRLALWQAASERHRARIEELHHLATWDVPQLVRQYTSCQRRGQ